jgi:hypothetical protein
MRASLSGHERLLFAVTGHAKNPACGAKSVPVLKAAMEEHEKNEKLASSINRGSFLGVGDNPPKLLSEKQPGLLTLNWDKFHDTNAEYCKDPAVPPQVFSLIQKYREKARKAKPSNDLGQLIDNFFNEVNEHLKDVQLREIARVKNENDVQIKLLMRQISELKSVSASSVRTVPQRSKSAASIFVDNDVAKELQRLRSENSALHAKVRAAEKLLSSGAKERVKFLEGALWLAQKVRAEVNNAGSQIALLIKEAAAPGTEQESAGEREARTK